MDQYENETNGNRISPVWMNEDIFWAIIELAHTKSGGDWIKKCQFIQDEIMRLSIPDAVEFAITFQKLLQKTDTWEHYDAARILFGKINDGIFEEFCASIVSMGRDVFEAVCENPEALSGFRYVKPSFTELDYGEEISPRLDFKSLGSHEKPKDNKKCLHYRGYCNGVVNAIIEVLGGAFPLYGPIQSHERWCH